MLYPSAGAVVVRYRLNILSVVEAIVTMSPSALTRGVGDIEILREIRRDHRGHRRGDRKGRAIHHGLIASEGERLRQVLGAKTMPNGKPKDNNRAKRAKFIFFIHVIQIGPASKPVVDYSNITQIYGAAAGANQRAILNLPRIIVGSALSIWS